MAAFDTSRTTYGTASAVNHFFAFLGDLITNIAAWNDARITRKVLSELTDRELDDIGLIRGDIDQVAQSDLIR